MMNVEGVVWQGVQILHVSVIASLLGSFEDVDDVTASVVEDPVSVG